MDRRSFILGLLLAGAAGIALPHQALADDGGDSGDGSDDEGSSDSGDSGSSGGGDGGSSGGQASDPLEALGESDHEDARKAVEAKNGIPLKDILDIFKKQVPGEVVDVSLFHGDAALRYRIKYVDPDGHVRRVYFDALTGAML